MNNQDEQNAYDDNQGEEATSEDNTQDKHEVIYILTNEAMPDYIKVGKSNENGLQDRIRSLSNTSVPFPFELFYACKVPKSRNAEKLFHSAFNKYRVSDKREFFEISPDEARDALLLTGCEEVDIDNSITNTITDKRQLESLERAKRRRGNFNFQIVGIDPGAELIFNGNEEKKVMVVDNKRVKLDDGTITSLSDATRRLFEQERHSPPGRQYSGPRHFQYGGETLADRRERMEKEDSDDDEDIG